MKRICQRCGKEFNLKLSAVKKNRGKYCSWQCRIFKVERICLYCEKKFLVKLSHLKKGGGKYCSRKCSAKHAFNSGKYRIGHIGHNCGKGKGYLNKKGYKIIQLPNHNTGRSRHRMREHRYIMEQLIGRKLKLTEVVHHKNEIKNDNYPSNLMLFKNKRAHQKYHYVIEGMKEGDILFDLR